MAMKQTSPDRKAHRTAALQRLSLALVLSFGPALVTAHAASIEVDFQATIASEENPTAAYTRQLIGAIPVIGADELALRNALKLNEALQ